MAHQASCTGKRFCHFGIPIAFCTPSCRVRAKQLKCCQSSISVANTIFRALSLVTATRLLAERFHLWCVFFQFCCQIDSCVLYWQLSGVQKMTAESTRTHQCSALCGWHSCDLFRGPAISCQCKILHSFSHRIHDLLLLPFVHLWHVVLCDRLSVRQDIPWLKTVQHRLKAFTFDSAERHHVFHGAVAKGAC